MFVDRAGGKVALQQQHSRNSRSSLGVVLEQVGRPPSRTACSASAVHALKPLVSREVVRW